MSVLLLRRSATELACIISYQLMSLLALALAAIPLNLSLLLLLALVVLARRELDDWRGRAGQQLLVDTWHIYLQGQQGRASTELIPLYRAEFLVILGTLPHNGLGCFFGSRLLLFPDSLTPRHWRRLQRLLRAGSGGVT